MSAAPLSPVVCFLDESATDARDSDFAVVGGLVMNRNDIPAFEKAWTAMLKKHRLPSLHMTELGPKGPHPHLVGDACSAMLVDAVKAINLRRIFSFAATWNNRDHENLFSAKLREGHFSVYGLIFLMVVEINRASAAKQNYTKTIDYVLDDGNRFKGQISQFGKSLKSVAELAKQKVGSVTFDTDSNVMALQAADVIVWATRRKHSGKTLNGVHEPLEGLFDQFYVHSPAPPHLIRILAARFEVAELNIDPDSFLGKCLMRRRVLLLAGLSSGVGLALISLLPVPLLFWASVCIAGATLLAFSVVIWKLKRR